MPNKDLGVPDAGTGAGSEVGVAAANPKGKKMIRNLKALGLALVAVFALSAMAATAASAQGKITSDSPVTLVISETGAAGANALTAFGYSVECPGTTYKGHKVNSTDLIASGSTTATITPTYKQPCHVNGGRQATIAPNGCDFVFHVGGTVSAPIYNVMADVVCPVAADGIHVTVFGNTPPAAHGANICTFEITGGALNQGLTGAAAVTAGNHINVAGTFHSIHVERTGLCIFDGNGTTTTAGQFHLDATVAGKSSGGGATAVSLSD